MKNIKTWKEILHLSGDLFQLAPWEYLEESDIFGVKTSVTGNTYFISVMGSAGHLRAISAYQGNRALEQFWKFQENTNAEPESILTIPHMILSYESKSNLDKAQIELFKETGIDHGKGKEWPDLRRIIPGLFPALPEDNYLDDFKEVLLQTINVGSRAKTGISFVHPEDQDEVTYLIREPVKRSGKLIWYDRYRTIAPEDEFFNINFELAEINALSSFRRTSAIVQAGFRMLPTPVREKNLPDHFPFTVMVTDKKSGIIYGAELLSPIPDYHSMIERVPSTIIKILTRHKQRPLRVEIKDPLLYELMKQVFNKCQINFAQVPSLNTFDEAFESMNAHVGKR